jgi:UDP-N-acetylglucosamine 2-epimerase (non-hydrolysing)
VEHLGDSVSSYVPSSPRKVLVVVGTRPEAIKLLPLVRAIRQSPHMDPVVVATGQHPGMVEEVLALGGIVPDADLAVARPGLSLNALFCSVLTGFEQFCADTFGAQTSPVQERDYQSYPAACVVHGDTTSAAASAVAAFHLQIPVIHVEAGLRTGDTRSPYPEELNRQIISRIAAFHLAPTDRNCENLVREGVPLNRVFVCGNTAIDALGWAADLRTPYDDEQLADLEHDEATRVIVVTAHRRENWGSGLDRIGTAVGLLADRYPDVRFVLPVHPNPRVAEVLEGRLAGRPNVALVRPMEYTRFARLLQRAYLAISDSGGVQEEAPALGTPVLVCRETTERQEGVDAGTLRLVGTDVEAIVGAATELLDDPDAYLAMASRTNPYGDGHAAERIVQAFEHVAFAAREPSPFGSGFDRLAVLRAGGFDDDPRAALLHSMPERLAVPDSHEELVEGADVR